MAVTVNGHVKDKETTVTIPFRADNTMPNCREVKRQQHLVNDPTEFHQRNSRIHFIDCAGLETNPRESEC